MLTYVKTSSPETYLPQTPFSTKGGPLLLKGDLGILAQISLKVSALARRIASLREDLLSIKIKTTDTPVTFITTFQHGTNISSILEEEKYQLELSPQTDHIAKMKFLTAYRRNRTLKNHLVRTSLNTTASTGNAPCNTPCSICKYMVTTTTFKSNNTGETYQIKGTINCNTSKVIYMIQCNRCKLQYIGQTSNAITTRIQQNIPNVKYVTIFFSKYIM
jgi:hypothetical protein